MAGNNYSESEILRMQNDAIRRVNQMRRRADSYVSRRQPQQTVPQEPPAPIEVEPVSQPEPEPESVPASEPAPDPAPTEERREAPPARRPMQQDGLLGNLLGGFGLDNDMLLIFGLIYLLSKEGANQSLIFSLLYILL